MKTTTGPHGKGRYYVIAEDIQFPSVTTILGEMTDKSGIEKWRKRVGEEKADEISKNSADRGTFMHELNERYQYLLVNEKDDNGILKKTFNDVLAKPEMSEIASENKERGKNLFIKMFNAGLFKRVKELKLQEEAVWSARGGGYAGRLDKAAIVEDGKLKIIDYKSSKKPKKEEWIENYKMQGAAYSVAYYDRFGIMPDGYEIWIANDLFDEVQVFKGDQQHIRHYFEKFHELVKQYHQKFHNINIKNTTNAQS